MEVCWGLKKKSKIRHRKPILSNYLSAFSGTSFSLEVLLLGSSGLAILEWRSWGILNGVFLLDGDHETGDVAELLSDSNFSRNPPDYSDLQLTLQFF